MRNSREEGRKEGVGVVVGGVGVMVIVWKRSRSSRVVGKSRRKSSRSKW